MLPSNAIMVARIASRVAGEGGGGGGFFVVDAEDVPFGSFWWFVDAGVSCLLVLFAGIMSGLTLGLMSLGLVDLEILQRSGTSLEKKQAGTSPPTSHAALSLLVLVSFFLLRFLLFVGFLMFVGGLLSHLPNNGLKREPASFVIGLSVSVFSFLNDLFVLGCMLRSRFPFFPSFSSF